MLSQKKILAMIVGRRDVNIIVKLLFEDVEETMDRIEKRVSHRLTNRNMRRLSQVCLGVIDGVKGLKG